MFRDLTPEILEEGLNEVFFDTYSPEKPPEFAEIGDIFKEETSNKHQEYDLEMRGVGRFTEKGEEEDIPEDEIAEEFKTTYSHVTYSNSLPVSLELLEDELYGQIKEAVGDMGMAARDTQHFKAFSIFRNAFDANFAGADGKPLVAADHPRELGGTLDNLLTAKLSPKSIQQAIYRMHEQKSLSGRLVPNNPKCLLVAPKNFKRAVEYTDAELVPGTANNGPNVFSTKYNISVKMSPYIGSSQGGDDDYWFLLGERHKVKRFIRKPLMTWVNDWKISRKTKTYYNARYRDSYGFSSPIGVMGSTGVDGSYPA